MKFILYFFEFYLIFYSFSKFIRIFGIVIENEREKKNKIKNVHSTGPTWYCSPSSLAKTQPGGPSSWRADARATRGHRARGWRNNTMASGSLVT
jgi:hypothetical protein